jgi:hypothetical protein
MTNYVTEILIGVLVVAAIVLRVVWGRTEKPIFGHACYACFGVAIVVALAAWLIVTPTERLNRQLDELQTVVETGDYEAMGPMLADSVEVQIKGTLEGPISRDALLTRLGTTLKRLGVSGMKLGIDKPIVEMKDRRATVGIRGVLLQQEAPVAATQWIVTLEYADKQWLITRAKYMGVVGE